MAAGLLLAFDAAAGTSAPPLPIAFEVSGRRGVSELERLRVERALAVELVQARCGLRLTVTPEERPALAISLILVSWREQDIPGGEPVLDLQTGRDRPGHVREVEVEYELELRRPAVDQPIERKQRRFTVSRGTTRIASWDPEVEARKLAMLRLGENLTSAVCSAARAIRRAERGASR